MGTIAKEISSRCTIAHGLGTSIALHILNTSDTRRFADELMTNICTSSRNYRYAQVMGITGTIPKGMLFMGVPVVTRCN